MTSPMPSQSTKRRHALGGCTHIKYPQHRIASSGTHGTNGVRKGRGRLGSVRLKTITPTATSTKANKVPMLHKSVASSILSACATAATKTPVKMVVMCGVLYFG